MNERSSYLSVGYCSEYRSQVGLGGVLISHPGKVHWSSGARAGLVIYAQREHS